MMVSAGAAQQALETRLDLLHRNLDVFRSVIPEIASVAPDAVPLIAANPIDALSDVAWKLLRFPSHRVVGSGTVLDTARWPCGAGRRSRGFRWKTTAGEATVN